MIAERGKADWDSEYGRMPRLFKEPASIPWLPRQRVLFAGDLVEAQAALYTGDPFHTDWSLPELSRACRRCRVAGG